MMLYRYMQTRRVSLVDIYMSCQLIRVIRNGRGSGLYSKTKFYTNITLVKILQP